MQSRGAQVPCNSPLHQFSRVAASNDGTLNAIVNNSVCSVDVPLRNVAPHQEDEMLSWLHYPVSDSLDRGYCSDIFGDLPYASAQVARQSFGELSLTPLNAPFSAGTSVFSVNLSHEKHAVSASTSRCTVSLGKTRDAAESCGSGSVEMSCRVAGADAVSGLGLCQAAGATSSSMELQDKWDPHEGHVAVKIKSAEHPMCDSSSANSSLLCMPSESSQTPSQVNALREALIARSRTVLEPTDVIGGSSIPTTAGKFSATPFASFARPSYRGNHAILSEGSRSTSTERARQLSGEHLLNQEGLSTCTKQVDAGAVHANWCHPPGSLTRSLPLPRALPMQLPSLPSALSTLDSRIPTTDASRPPIVLPPPSFLLGSVDEMQPDKTAATCSNLSGVSAEKDEHTADQTATSPSRGSGSSGERTGIGTEGTKTAGSVGAADEVDFQSRGPNDGPQFERETGGADKKSSSNAKRLRTAEMHNQSERKRRVKINDKLKTLQQLIPNGNKPDKASLLDAVIEYIKLLQSQLQMMAMRTGVGIPSWMIPTVTPPYAQLPSITQMRLSSDMGMGMGVGVGMGMRMGVGMMDGRVSTVGSGCTIMPMSLFPSPSPVQCSTSLNTADAMQSPGLMNFMVGPSHNQNPCTSQNPSMYNGLQQPISHPLEQQSPVPSRQSPTS